MATDFSAFRPEIWAAEFAMYFKTQTGLVDTVSRFDELAGQQGYGYTIKIPALHLGAVATVTPGSAVTLATVNSDLVTLTLDQMPGYAIQVTPQDERFSHPQARAGALADAARQIKNSMNTTLLALVDDGSVTNVGNASTGGVLTDADVREAGRLLDEAEMPDEGRILVCTSDAYSDLLGQAVFTDSDFGDGQNQNAVRMVRGFRVIKLPDARFPVTSSVYRMMAFHPLAIGAAIARPHMRLVERGGLFDTVLEMAQIWGNKIRKGTGIVKLYR